MIAGARDVPRGDVVVLLNAPDDAVRSAMAVAFPGARLMTLGRELPSRLAGALRAARSIRANAVVVAQHQRKLELVAMAVPGASRFVVRRGILAPLAFADLAVEQAMALPRVRSTARRVRRRVESLRRASDREAGLALDNDFSALARRVADLPIGWERLEVSVVIPVYNRRPILAKTLAALAASTYPLERVEVIIADDGSHDEPELLVRRFRDRLRVCVVRQEDLGFRAARVRNLGMQAARGEVIVLLDCDMLPAPELLAAHARWFHVTDAPLVTVGGRRFVATDDVSVEDIETDPRVVERLPDRLAPAAIRLADAPTLDWRIPRYDETHDLRKEPYGYRFGASGNLAFFRRDALAVGGFDESYQRWGGEDVEFSYRLYRRGAWFIAEREALAHHQEHPDAVVREEDAQTTRVMTRSKIPVERIEALGETFDVAKVAIVSPVPATFTQVGVSTQVRCGELSAAIDAARAEYILEVGEGDQLDPDCAARLADALDRNPRVNVAVAAFALPDGRTRLSTVAGRPRMYRARDWYRAKHLASEGEQVGRALERLAEVVTVERVLSTCGEGEARQSQALATSVAFEEAPVNAWCQAVDRATR
ncbi:MAG: glycosyltransferase [Deltaproteobacteria bacterium]